MSDYEDEYGFCVFCGWCDSYMDSHIDWGKEKCIYIKNKYDKEIKYKNFCENTGWGHLVSVEDFNKRQIRNGCCVIKKIIKKKDT